MINGLKVIKRGYFLGCHRRQNECASQSKKCQHFH